MKIVINANTTNKKYAVPISFYGTSEEVEQKASTTTERDEDSTAHELRYDPNNAESATYKIYLQPFSGGSPEEWLLFLKKIDQIILGNGLDEDGPAQYNLTRTILKNQAKQAFENKAHQLGEETVANHVLCLQAVTLQIFQKHALQVQKRHLRSYYCRFRPKDTTVKEYFERWREVNDYLAEFPPFDGDLQKLPEDEIVELIYSRLPARMKGDLERMQEFDINVSNMLDFQEALERLELSYELASATNDGGDKNNKKQEGESGKKKKKRSHGNESQSATPSPKKRQKFCLYHDKMGTQYDHMTNDCEVLKHQAEQMVATYNAQTPQKRRQMRQEAKDAKPFNRKEVHAMIGQAVEAKMKPMLEEAFAQHFKRVAKRKRELHDPFDYESDSDKEQLFGIDRDEDINLNAAVASLGLD